MENKAPKKEIEVFRESKDFFEYFEIPKYQELIIKRLIPDYYFTTIDNWSLDLNLEKIFNISEYYTFENLFHFYYLFIHYI